MQYSDTSGGQGIIQDAEYRTNIGLGGISGDTDLLKMFTAWANNGYSKAFYTIITANKKWTIDDPNHTDRPVATTALVNGQSQYTIIEAAPDAGKDWLHVKRVEITTDDDTYVLLPAASLDELRVSVDEVYEADSQPTFYYFDGSSIFLNPAPNYAKAAGLKIWFARSPLFFATSDTTKRPGFASIFHDYIPTFMTYMWEKYKRVGDAEQTKRDLAEMEANMKKHYSEIDRTLKSKLTPVHRRWK